MQPNKAIFLKSFLVKDNDILDDRNIKILINANINPTCFKITRVKMKIAHGKISLILLSVFIQSAMVAAKYNANNGST